MCFYNSCLNFSRLHLKGIIKDSPPLEFPTFSRIMQELLGTKLTRNDPFISLLVIFPKGIIWSISEGLHTDRNMLKTYAYQSFSQRKALILPVKNDLEFYLQSKFSYFKMHREKDRLETNALWNSPLTSTRSLPPQIFFCTRWCVLDLPSFRHGHCILQAKCCLKECLTLFRILLLYDCSLLFAIMHGPVQMADVKSCVFATTVHCNIWSGIYPMR